MAYRRVHPSVKEPKAMMDVQPCGTTARRRKNHVLATRSLFSALLFAISFSTVAVGLSFRRATQQLELEARHPLVTRRRRRRKLRTAENTPNKLKYLSFAKSGDDGSAYPNLLDSDSLLIPLISADLAAACTQSMVGEEHFDVITIEYGEFTNAHSVLLDRLKQRFPSSLIILLEEARFVLKDAQDKTVSLPEWRTGKMNVDGTLKLARTSFGSKSELITIQNRMKSDPLLMHYQLPSPSHFLSSEQLSQFLELYDDVTVLSEAGHARVARDLRALVSTVDFPRRVSTGSWGSGDDCKIWYATGDYNLVESSGGQQANLAEDDGFFAPHKHALEFTSRGEIQVHNPFGTDRLLSLTYLTDANSMAYPKTRIVLNGIPTVLLQPFHDEGPHQHVARTSGVGFVPPGNSSVLIDPLQSTKLPFRLLGASLLAEEVQELDTVEFALEPEKLAATMNDDDRIIVDSSATGLVASLFR